MKNILNTIAKRLDNLFKVKSIVTFVFLFITILCVIKGLELPEWLVPIITLCFKELFDKDKIKNIETESKGDE